MYLICNSQRVVNKKHFKHVIERKYCKVFNMKYHIIRIILLLTNII